MQTKLIIFDFDGVILDTFDLTRHIYTKFAEEFSNKTLRDNIANPEFFRDFFELDWRKTLKKIDIVTKEDIGKADALFVRMSKEFRSMIKVYDGMEDVLRELSKKYSMAIVSNNYKALVSRNLRNHGLSGFFSMVVGAEDGKMKPSPDLIIKCMHRMKARPEETVFIGDMDGDIAAAKAAHIKKVIAVSYGYHSLSRLKEADVIIDSPRELLEAVQ
jgi:HAD superfamily hydrolase (TIGR01549 family)